MNYARMEEVWRSYGPLEAIGPEENSRRTRRRTGAVVAGVVAVCAVGAAAGFYLQPDLEKEPRSSRADARDGTASRDPGSRSPTASPVLTEAEALEAQLQLAVADTSTPLPVSGAATTPDLLGPGAFEAPVSIQPPFAQPPLAQRPTGPMRPPLVARTQPPGPTVGVRPPPPASTRNVGPVRPAIVAERPLVTASISPPVRMYPREAPVRPVPRPPAPVQVATAPPPPPPSPPAPDCSRGSAADRMVCGSPDLAALDRRMETELAAAVAAGHNRSLLLRDQNDWRTRRDAAAPDPRAVADAYRRRIGQLQSMH